MSGRSTIRDPQGIAHWDYDLPCPGCRKAIRTGDEVYKIVLPEIPARWWHAECRRDYVKQLIGSESV